jgi:hypothetical protein
LREEDYSKLAIRADLAETPREFPAFEEESFATVAKPEPLNEAAYDGLYPPAWEVEAAREYLISRKIGEATAITIGLLYDEEERRILFPIRDKKNRLYGFSGRSILPKNMFPPGYPRHRDYNFRKEHFLLGEHLYQKGKPIWLVEGLFAYARMVEIGARKYVNPIAPMMSSLSVFQKEKLVDFGETVYVCFDPDQAGDIGMFGPIRNGEHIGGGVIDKIKKELTVMVPPYPEELTDIDDVTLNQFLWMGKNAELV